LDTIREGGFLVSKIKQISERIFDKKLKAYQIGDLNAAQGRIIFSLWRQDNIPISELAHKTALGKTTLTSMLHRLTRYGYIIKTDDKKDSRKAIISLTRKSKSLESRYQSVSKEMTDLFYRGLNDRQIDEFEATLRKILSNLEEHEERRNNGEQS
jgi:DNA-binding MarR family transcriptional regulator